jgi:hypothetical protein
MVDETGDFYVLEHKVLEGRCQATNEHIADYVARGRPPKVILTVLWEVGTWRNTPIAVGNPQCNADISPCPAMAKGCLATKYEHTSIYYSSLLRFERCKL